MKGQRGHLLKGAAWVSMATLVVNALGFVSLIALTRILMPDDFGLVAIAASLAQIIGLVLQLSLSQALIQRKDVEPAHFHTSWTLGVARGVIIASLLALSGPIVAEFYGDERLADLLRFLALAPLIGGFGNPKMVVFQRKLDFKQAAVLSIADKLTVFTFSVGIAVIYQSYWALVAGTVAGTFATTVLSYTFISYRPRIAVSKWKDLLSFSIWLTLGTWVQAINWRSTPLLLGFFLPVPLVGQYRVGNQVIEKTVDEAMRPIKALLFPAFSRLQDESERLRQSYLRSQGTICLITYPVAAGLAVLAEDLVRLTMGEKWLLAVPVIQILAVSRLFRAVHNIRAIAMASASTKELFYRNLVVFCVRWPMTFAGMAFFWGDTYEMLIGAMIGQFGSAIISTALNVRLIKKISAVSEWDHVSIVWRPLIAITAMVAIVALAGQALPSSTVLLELGLRILVLAALGAVTYFGALFAIWVLQGRGNTVEKELALIIHGLAGKAIAKVRPS
ncbi:MAG: lipopolysaccharide biosynthesis protein [Pseudomonadota bacterium]